MSSRQTPFIKTDFLSVSALPENSLTEHHHQVSQHHCCEASVQDDGGKCNRVITYYFLDGVYCISSGTNSLMLFTAYGLGTSPFPWKDNEIEAERVHIPALNSNCLLKQNSNAVGLCSSILSTVVTGFRRHLPQSPLIFPLYLSSALLHSSLPATF